MCVGGLRSWAFGVWLYDGARHVQQADHHGGEPAGYAAAGVHRGGGGGWVRGDWAAAASVAVVSAMAGLVVGCAAQTRGQAGADVYGARDERDPELLHHARPGPGV